MAAHDHQRQSGVATVHDWGAESAPSECSASRVLWLWLNEHVVLGSEVGGKSDHFLLDMFLKLIWSTKLIPRGVGLQTQSSLNEEEDPLRKDLGTLPKICVANFFTILAQRELLPFARETVN